MNNKNYLITNIGQLNGILVKGIKCLKGEEMSHINSIKDAYLLVENGRIRSFGPMSDCPQTDCEKFDAESAWLMPGFVDSHTHMVFAGSRHNEYVMRLKGMGYAEIAAQGGGILNSAKRLAVTEEDSLYEMAKANLEKAKSHGTVAIEIKSGYGLSVDAELKMLRVIKRLKESSDILIKATFLGAHAIPAEYKPKREEYIKLIKEEMLPQIAKDGLADFMDVFCDEGFFTPEETDNLLKAAEKYGLRAKIHGNELGLTGGVQVAVANRALSVDHLEHISDKEIECLRDSDTMPVALPGSSFFLKIPYTPARKIIDAGLPIALASDFNPGSSPVYNLWFIWSLACLYNGMMPEEGFNALTINAAKALGIEEDYGSITEGKKACLILTREFEHINEMPYWLTSNHVKKIFN